VVGNCTETQAYTGFAAQLLREPRQKILVVHGTILDTFNHRFMHAWIEYAGVVYDPTFSIIAPAQEWYTSGSRFRAVLLPDMPPLLVGSAELQAKYPLIVAVRTCFRHTQGPWFPEEVEWRS
jgi:hypothetical protein